MRFENKIPTQDELKYIVDMDSSEEVESESVKAMASMLLDKEIVSPFTTITIRPGSVTEILHEALRAAIMAAIKEV